jgi:hypothetical protein
LLLNSAVDKEVCGLAITIDASSGEDSAIGVVNDEMHESEITIVFTHGTPPFIIVRAATRRVNSPEEGSCATPTIKLAVNTSATEGINGWVKFNGLFVLDVLDNTLKRRITTAEVYELTLEVA